MVLLSNHHNRSRDYRLPLVAVQTGKTAKAKIDIAGRSTLCGVAAILFLPWQRLTPQTGKFAPYAEAAPTLPCSLS